MKNLDCFPQFTSLGEPIIKTFKIEIGTKWVYRNKKDERGIVIKNKAILVAQGHTQEEGIDYDEVFAPVARIEAIRLFLAYASFKDFVVYQMDVKSIFLYGRIEEEVCVCQPPGIEDPNFPDKVYKVEKALYGLHQALRACQDKYVTEVLKLFDFLNVKTASTLMASNNPLNKDEEAKDVDVHLYISMIGSLMYLIASRPNITFAVSAYARFQVNPKTPHLHAVKRIFRYLKGQPKLGLWYPKHSPFDLKAYSDSDYVGASLDRKSTTGGCQFLGKRLISWQCKKQTIVANSTTKAEYVVAANCYGQVNDKEQIQALVDKTKVIITEDNIRSDLCFDDAEGTACLLSETIFEGMARHEEMYIISSHTKKIFANMRRIEAGFSVRKEADISHDESDDKDHVPTPSSDPLPSGEDSSILNELMVFCIGLQEQGRTNDDEMFKVDDLAGEEVVMDSAAELVTIVKDSDALTTDVTEDEITMAQALAALKSIKPNVVVQEQETSTTIPAVATTVTTAVPTPRAKGLMKSMLKSYKLKNKTARLSRAQQDKEVNSSWNNMQAMMDADRLLAKMLQAKEKEEFYEVEKERLLVELIEKRKKHFATLRDQEKRNKPPPKLK
nr:ribonuclease H-like domain, reverse transcriptase, RNA-dependent DNA polymerase [Tanacetum cinerariifolium]